MLEGFLKVLNQELDARDARFLLAVSGGVDSMVLLDLFRETKLDVVVAHCNFNLRGEASNLDQALVQGYCKEHSIPYHVKSFNTSEISVSRKESTQLVARELRYTWFRELSEQLVCHYIATAHHSDDQIETVLLNMIRGSSVKGLSGMKSKRSNLVRPLLKYSKAELITYAKDRGIVWREDASNGENKYRRNFVRNELITLLETQNPNFKSTFLNNIERWNWADEYLEEQLTIYKTNIQKEDGFEFCLKREDRYLIAELLKEKGFTFEQIISIQEASHSGKQWLSQHWEVLFDRGKVLLFPQKERKSLHLTIEGEGCYHLDSKQISVSLEDVPDQMDRSEKTAWLDASKLTFPCTIRSWKQGDRFKPLGMTGEKKLSDFMIDKKIPLNLKNEICVLVDSEGDIAWVIGYRIDDRFKITEHTEKVFRIDLN